jgi:hypothetical protein
MIRAAGRDAALQTLKASFKKLLFLTVACVVALVILYYWLTARVAPNELGVEQVRFGLKTGIKDRIFGPGLYFVPPGTVMHVFPGVIHVLEATLDYQEARDKARSEDVKRRVDKYFQERNEVLGQDTHRVLEALNVQTSDGFAVTADITLLYSIENPVQVAKEFGWGSLYVDAFVINTFRNGVLTTLGKMNAESFYDEDIRIPALAEAEALLKERFTQRGFRVDELLLRNYSYARSYEKSLQDKKVAVQDAEKNRQEALVSEERAKLQQIESKGNATITIAESAVNAEISKIRAEADLYWEQVKAKADTEVNLALAEAKRLKAEALSSSGGRYVVALETAKMFDNIQGSVMTPEQYIAFIRNAWSVIGVGSGSSASGSKP